MLSCQGHRARSTLRSKSAPELTPFQTLRPPHQGGLLRCLHNTLFPNSAWQTGTRDHPQPYECLTFRHRQSIFPRAPARFQSRTKRWPKFGDQSARSWAVWIRAAKPKAALLFRRAARIIQRQGRQGKPGGQNTMSEGCSGAFKFALPTQLRRAAETLQEQQGDKNKINKI